MLNITKKQYNIIKFLIIALGIFLRLFFINRFPAGLNCDEATSTYEAYSLLTTMRDRNNLYMPVYFLSFGSGQSVLLSYIMIPFVKFLGMNIWATRLPMAIVSSLSLIIFFEIFEIYWNKNNLFVLYAGLFLAINPWHVMKSRWGLDCNLFPDLVLFSIYFIILFITYRKSIFLYVSIVIISLSAYSYATSFFILPIFCLAMFLFLLKHKYLSKLNVAISLVLVLCLTWPLILFIIINFFDMQKISLEFLTIPKLTVNRMADKSVFGQGNIIVNMIKNFMEFIKLIILQFDGLYWNAIIGIGIFYMFSLPLFFIGIIHYIKKKKNDIDTLFFIWLIVGIFFCFFIEEVNVNRCNFVIFPFIYFIIQGTLFLFIRMKVFVKVIIILLVINFICFIFIYTKNNLYKEITGCYPNNYGRDVFATEMEPLISYLDSLDVSKIYMGNLWPETHVYVLYYTKYNPHQFYMQKKIFDKNAYIDNVKSFGKWDFTHIDSISTNRKYVYVLRKAQEKMLDKSLFNIKYIGNYIVVYGK